MFQSVWRPERRVWLFMIQMIQLGSWGCAETRGRRNALGRTFTRELAVWRRPSRCDLRELSVDGIASLRT